MPASSQPMAVAGVGRPVRRHALPKGLCICERVRVVIEHSQAYIPLSLGIIFFLSFPFVHSFFFSPSRWVDSAGRETRARCLGAASPLRARLTSVADRRRRSAATAIATATATATAAAAAGPTPLSQGTARIGTLPFICSRFPPALPACSRCPLRRLRRLRAACRV